MPVSPSPPPWPDDACLGAGLPPAAERALALAGQHYDEPQRALAWLEQARREAPGHYAVDIGLYRLHFYQGRLEEALAVAEDCLARAVHALGMPGDWRALTPASAVFSDYAPLPRFVLFGLKAYAYLQLRRGRRAEGEEALAKLAQLDPGDCLKGSVLRAVLAPETDDD